MNSQNRTQQLNKGRWLKASEFGNKPTDVSSREVTTLQLLENWMEFSEFLSFPEKQ